MLHVQLHSDYSRLDTPFRPAIVDDRSRSSGPCDLDALLDAPSEATTADHLEEAEDLALAIARIRLAVRRRLGASNDRCLAEHLFPGQDR